MPRWLVLTLVLARIAAAAPHVASHDPAFAEAEKLWAAAKDPRGWRAAADAFFALAATAPDPLLAARSGWAAARNAVGDARAKPEVLPFPGKPAPRPLSELDAWFVQRAEQYEQLAAGSPDAVVAEFLRANTLRRYDHLEEANALYLDIVAAHRDHAVAEYAANLVADTFARLEQYDQLVGVVDQLRTDKAFLARFPDLAHLVHLVHLKALRDGEPIGEGSRGPQTFAAYEAVGERYLDAIEPGESDRDELLYNALVSFERARLATRAIEVGERLLREVPRSRLAPRVVAHVARDETDIGLFADAARDLERYAALAPGEADVRDALDDAVLFRIGLGELAQAARDLDALARAPHESKDDLARMKAQLADAGLALPATSWPLLELAPAPLAGDVTALEHIW